MERLAILALIALGCGLSLLGWQLVKARLQQNIEVEPALFGRNKPAVLYFSAEHCLPCRLRQAPIVAELQRVLGNEVTFFEYDAVAHPGLARRYRVLTVPTTVVVAPGGDVVAVNYGIAEAAKLRAQLGRTGVFSGEVPLPTTV
jgi:thiol-disulfide isomerase/thioredoxin